MRLSRNSEATRTTNTSNLQTAQSVTTGTMHEYTLHSCWEVQSLLYARKLFACAVLPEHRHRSAPPTSAAIFRGKGTTDLTEGTAHSTQHLDIQAHLSVPAISGTQTAHFMARHMVGPFLQLRIRE